MQDTNYKQATLINLSKKDLDLNCVDFHLDLPEWMPQDLSDDRCMDQPFTPAEVFDSIIALNIRKANREGFNYN